ncbi:MAG: hypothetical protein QNJ30_19715 [Kiloniellales bacterium]|nr:hypothetical protein [Kiloniellales bacterium]
MRNAFMPAAALALLVLGATPGCSVGMALSGDENPDLSVIRVGATRGEVELHLGAPIKTEAGRNGERIDTYEYEIGDEPSAGRAVAHGVADVLTLGLWELVGTPIEAVQGETYITKITYDSRDKVRQIATEKAPDPEPKPQEAERD